MNRDVTFKLLSSDPRSKARTGLLSTPHGMVETPAFMPVGTRGTVKGLTPSALSEAGVQMVLVNAFHLLLRPGSGLIRDSGGIGRMMGLSVPTLSDSGGYQILSLSGRRTISEEGFPSFRPTTGAKCC